MGVGTLDENSVPLGQGGTLGGFWGCNPQPLLNPTLCKERTHTIFKGSICLMLNRLCLALLLANCIPVLVAQVHQHGTTSKEDGRYNPFVAADPRGGFYLAYVERKAGISNVMLQQSADGKSFSEAVRVNDPSGDATVRNENPPKVVVGPTGQIYVCWANERGRWKGNVRFARSLDGGKTFSPAISINSDAAMQPAGHAFQSVAVDHKGRIYVTWIDERNRQPGDRGAEIWMSTSTNEGRTFSPDRRVLGDVCECCRTHLQIDASGRMFLSYRTVPPSGPMFRDIVLAVSQDGGKTFAKTVVNQDGWEVNACPVAGPALCIDSQGQVAVTWFTGGGDRPGLYYASSTDHGTSFSPRRLLSPNQKLGKHSQAAVVSQGKILVAWDDVADATVTLWGLLHLKDLRLQELGWQGGASYPVVAISGQTALIAAAQLSVRELFFRSESLTGR
jgi:BNR repeat-like domain